MTTLTRRAAREAWARQQEAIAPLRLADAPLAPASLLAGWGAIEEVLRVLVASPDAEGQPLIAAARQSGVLTLEQTHALLEALAVVTRAREVGDLPPSPAEAGLVRSAVDVVERVVHDEPLVPPERESLAPATSSPVDAGHWAPPPLPQATMSSMPPGAPAAPRPADAWAPPSASAGVLTPPAAVQGASSGGARSAGLVVGGLALLILGGVAGAWLFGRGRADRGVASGAAATGASPALDACRTAFEARDVARAQGACAEAAGLARSRPDHAIALVYLARLKRTAGDVQGAIADADLAQRLLPVNGVALRELGAAFLDANTPGEARRAFVAAVQGDTTDRVAMAGLACALHRMGRVEEARRWRTRAADQSAFDACLAAPPGR